MKPVIQQEQTGCAIASAAAIAGISYEQAKKIANSLGIYAEDKLLWSDPSIIRKLLNRLGVNTSDKESEFTNWSQLPNCALLATKWHIENNQPFWHWTVFRREENEAYVLDSKKSLKNHIRTDFGRIKPKWFIEIYL